MIPVEPFLFLAFCLLAFMSYYMLNRMDELQTLVVEEQISERSRLIEHIIIVLLLLNLSGGFWMLAWPTVEAFFDRIT